MIYLQLFYSYLKIGFFGFGGGYAMLSLIQKRSGGAECMDVECRVCRHCGRVADDAPGP